MYKYMQSPDVARFKELQADPKDYSVCNQLLRLATKLKSDSTITPLDYQRLLLGKVVLPDQSKEVTLQQYRKVLQLGCGLFFLSGSSRLPKDVIGEIVKHVKFDYSRFFQLQKKAKEMLHRKRKYLAALGTKKQRQLQDEYAGKVHEYNQQDRTDEELDELRQVYTDKMLAIRKNFARLFREADDKYIRDITPVREELRVEVELLAKELGTTDIRLAWRVANHFPMFDHPYIRPYILCILGLLHDIAFDPDTFGTELATYAPYKELIYRATKNYVRIDSREELLEIIFSHPLNTIDEDTVDDIDTVEVLNPCLRRLLVKERLPEKLREDYIDESYSTLERPDIQNVDCLAAYQFFLLYNADKLDDLRNLVFSDLRNLGFTHPE